MPRLQRPSSLPLREELEVLAHAYLHVHNEIERTRPGSSIRRRLEERLLDIRERFDRLLEEWVNDEGLRERWRAHLHTHGPAPDEPRGTEPVAFRGENDAGSVAEVRGRGNEFRVFVDGSLLERVDAEKDLASPVPGLVFRVDGFEFRETFAAPREALQELAASVEAGEQPPWEYVHELLADGLIDVHLELTPRGRRALAGSPR